VTDASTKSGRLFQIIGAGTRKARDAVTVFTRCGTIKKLELDESSVLADVSPVSNQVADSFAYDT